MFVFLHCHSIVYVSQQHWAGIEAQKKVLNTGSDVTVTLHVQNTMCATSMNDENTLSFDLPFGYVVTSDITKAFPCISDTFSS